MTTVRDLEVKFRALAPCLNERSRRVWAAAEARSMGRGGVMAVHRATGLTRSAIYRGIREIEGGGAPAGRVRRPGGGRKKRAETDPDFPRKLEELVEPLARGDPCSPLRWTCKSSRRLAGELKNQGCPVSHTLVTQTLRALGYSLQANRKTEEGASHPDRNAQFEFIDARVRAGMSSGDPVISVDTKKKELVGNYKNNGREWHRKGGAPKVNGHDFPGPGVPRAHPYGVYDLKADEGFVNIGRDHDTSQFAVASIRAWWRAAGRAAYPRARRILITADSGGSNGYRPRLWKRELQALADETGLSIRVSHFPPGTSKWNKVEHRLFSFISQNWRGVPLSDYETIVSLISSTTTRSGLNVRCLLDTNAYPLKQRVTDAEMADIRLFPDAFHGEWNYEIKPRRRKCKV